MISGRRPPGLGDVACSRYLFAHPVAVFADAYGMTARHRAEFAPFAVDMVRRYHEDSRASAGLDPVFRELWEDGAKDALPRAEAWLREAAPAIAARLRQPRWPGVSRSGRAVPPRRLTASTRPSARAVTIAVR